MTGREILWFALVGIGWILLGLAMSALFGSIHVEASLIGLALSGPAAIATFALTRWMMKQHPLGALMGMMVGIGVRMLITVAGGLIIFLVTDRYRPCPLCYWIWVLLAYLVTMVLETGLLVRSTQASRVRTGEE